MHYNYTDIKAIIAEILEAKKDDGGVKNLYFVGCGGSLGALYPAKELIERESTTLKTGWGQQQRVCPQHAKGLR